MSLWISTTICRVTLFLACITIKSAQSRELMTIVQDHPYSVAVAAPPLHQPQLSHLLHRKPPPLLQPRSQQRLLVPLQSRLPLQQWPTMVNVVAKRMSQLSFLVVNHLNFFLDRYTGPTVCASPYTCVVSNAYVRIFVVLVCSILNDVVRLIVQPMSLRNICPAIRIYYKWNHKYRQCYNWFFGPSLVLFRVVNDTNLPIQMFFVTKAGNSIHFEIKIWKDSRNFHK